MPGHDMEQGCGTSRENAEPKLGTAGSEVIKNGGDRQLRASTL
jgi:hypothetical protein